MLKLYKQLDDKTLYWEAWSTTNEVIVHWGTVGEKGESRVIGLKASDNPFLVIQREAQMQRIEGYEVIENEKLTQLIIQYKIGGMGTASNLAQRHQVEEVMNECLGWTGLGHCDGGDIGSGTMNVFCFVVDSGLAFQVALKELKARGLLMDAVIAIGTKKEKKVVWPEQFTGKFSL